MNRETASQVNTLVLLAAPIDQPVLNLDFYMESFYRKTNRFWIEHRPPNPNPITNLTNTCCNASNYAITLTDMLTLNASESDGNSKRQFLRDILVVTIGGGNRDLLVRSGLTSSQFSDIHTMSTCMPNVWLTTDHLSAVWCLQQVMVINRFLYSIVQTSQSQRRLLGNTFIEDKAVRLAKAKHYFTVILLHFFTFLFYLQVFI